MRILDLSLTNFQGVEKFTLKLEGKSAYVYGANGTGKTTLASAWSWLLYGKDAYGRSKFDLRPLDKEGIKRKEEETSVEARIKTESGRVISLKKVIKSGSGGVTVDHFLDEIPMKKGEYEKTVSSLLPEETSRLLSSPAYFCGEKPHGLGWEERRKILGRMFPANDGDLIRENPALAELPDLLGGHTHEERKREWKAKEKELAGEREKISPKIEELKEQIGAVPEVDIGDLRNHIPDAKKKVRDLEEKRANVLARGATGELKFQLAEVLRQVLEDSVEKRGLREGIIGEKTGELNKLLEEEITLIREITSLSSLVEDLKLKNKETSQRLFSLRADFQTIGREKPEPGKKCLACSQLIPLDLQEAGKKARLKEINESGKETKQHWEEQDRLLKDAISRLSPLEKEREEKAAEIETLKAEIKAISSRAVEEPVALVVEKERLLKALSEAEPRTELEGLNIKIKALEAEISTREKEIANQERRQENLTRIGILAEKEREISGEIEELERKLSLLSGWETSKARLMENQINDRFKGAQFRFFRELENGKEEEGCDPMVGGVPWGGSLNGGAKTNAGLEIIEALSSFYGVSAPVFVDNAESVDYPFPLSGQMVLLVDDKLEEKLKVSLKEENNEQ